MLWLAEKLMVKAEVEALVAVRLFIQARPLLFTVRYVVEAFNVYVVVATVRFPAKYPLPFTERSCPGVVVPMPTRPAFVIRTFSVADPPVAV